jgi:hypothetical protein
MSDRRIASVIRGSSVSSTSRIQRVVIENMKVRERTTDLRAMAAELMMLNASGMREKSQKRAQRMTRRLKYQAGSYANMRRCHFSSRVQVPCSVRLYSSVSVGTSACFQVGEGSITPSSASRKGKQCLHTYQVYRILSSCCEVVDRYSRDFVRVALLEDFPVIVRF